MNEATCRIYLVEHLRRQGFTVDDETRHGWDIIARAPGASWFIEVKGGDFRQSASYSVDFHTAVGQVVSQIEELAVECRYGIAVPREEVERRTQFSYRSTFRRYAKSMLWEAMRVSLLLVTPDDVTIIAPSEVCPYLQTIEAKR